MRSTAIDLAVGGVAFAIGALAVRAALAPAPPPGMRAVEIEREPAILSRGGVSPDGRLEVDVGAAGSRLDGAVWSALTLRDVPSGRDVEIALWTSGWPTWRTFGAVRWAPSGAPIVVYDRSLGGMPAFELEIVGAP